MTQDPMDKAMALWLITHFNLDCLPERISDVAFEVTSGGGCPTCAYEEMGISFKLGGRYRIEELVGVGPAHFVREVSALYQSILEQA